MFIKLKFFAPLVFVLCFVSLAFADVDIQVRHVLDGDTLILKKGQRVRLIGVDAPELKDNHGRNQKTAKFVGTKKKVIQKYAHLARKMAQAWIRGEELYLEFDSLNEGINHLDQYGRLLAYVCRKSDRQCLNAELIRQGHGLTYRRFDFKEKENYLAIENDAKKKGRGFWKETKS